MHSYYPLSSGQLLETFAVVKMNKTRKSEECAIVVNTGDYTTLFGEQRHANMAYP